MADSSSRKKISDVLDPGDIIALEIDGEIYFVSVTKIDELTGAIFTDGVTQERPDSYRERAVSL